MGSITRKPRINEKAQKKQREILIFIRTHFEKRGRDFPPIAEIALTTDCTPSIVRYHVRQLLKQNLIPRPDSKSIEYKPLPRVRHKSTGGKGTKSSRVRAIVIEHLGARCCRCGFDDIHALQIDHVNGGGRKELAEMKGSTNLYSKLYKKIR